MAGSVAEDQRLGMLRSLDLLDQPMEPLFSDYAALAADLARTPIALVSLVDADRQWFAGRHGLAAPQTPRSSSFCAHAIERPGQVMWVQDALFDQRFNTNPLVLGPPHIRFYAGAPLVVHDQAIGALCVIAPTPRPYDLELSTRLQSLASLLSATLEERRRERQLTMALEATSDAIIECDDHGIITRWNHGAIGLFGFDEHEAVGQAVTIFVPPNRRAEHDAGIENWRRTGKARLNTRLNLPAVRKDGTELTIELCMSVSRKLGSTVITSTVRDITESQAQAEALRAAKQEAETANVAKSAFLANMSHEIRTPLNGIVGVAHILATTRLNRRQRELTNIIQQSSHQLEHLLGDILDLARIESGHLALAKEPVSLEAVVSSVVNLSALRAGEKGLTIEAEIDQALPGAILGDAVRIKQIVTNLLINAIKFTDRGSVTLKVLASGACCRFEIHDTGIGLDASQQKIVFERFRQVDEAANRRFEGSGLGLAISRELVAAMGGEIGCSSALGEGSVFWFELPLTAAHSQAEHLGDAVCQPADHMRVLLADDNATNRRVIELILDSVGAQITSVDNGAKALSAYKTAAFDVVLMDMMMPVMDGLEAVRAIRAYEDASGRRGTPIVMLTANALPEHVAASFSAGADHYVSKPVSPASLLQALGSLQAHHTPAPKHSSAKPACQNAQRRRPPPVCA